VLQGQLAVSALQFLLGTGACHTQYFVIIAFCVGRQNKPFP
jgi:hypothetical protein